MDGFYHIQNEHFGITVRSCQLARDSQPQSLMGGGNLSIAPSHVYGSLSFDIDGPFIPDATEISDMIFGRLDGQETHLDKCILDLMACGQDSEKFKEVYPQLLDEIDKLRHSLEQAEDLAEIFHERLTEELTIEHLSVDL